MKLSAKPVLKHFPGLLDRINYIDQLVKMLRLFKRAENPWKVPTTSRDTYDADDDSEQRDYYGPGRTLCRDGKRNVWATHREARMRYLAPIFAEIDARLKTQDQVAVREIGCGNCINLIELKERYGEKIDLHGTDISTGRINTAKGFFGDLLDGVNIWIESITEPTPSDQHDQYDLVFSMHCLEQIPYAVVQAVQGIWERTRGAAIMVEPVWEFGRPAQKLKLVRNDFVRTLLPTVRYLGYNTVKAEPLGFESSQKNQTSLIILKKD